MIWLVNPGKRKRKAKSKKRRGAKRTGRVSFRRADGTTVSFGGGKKSSRKSSRKKHGNTRRSAAVRRVALRNLAKARKALSAKKSKKRGKSSRKSTSVAKRATKKGPSMAKRKGKKKTKAQRRAIALKNLAKARSKRARRSASHTRASIRMSEAAGRSRSRSRRSVRSAGRALARRRHGKKTPTIGAQRAGRRLAKYRWTGNPVSGITGAITSVAPLAASFYVGNFASRKIGSIPGIGPFIGKLGTHAAPVASIALLVAGHFATKKISGLQKYAGPIMQGFALNFINTAVATYAPASVKGMIGVGDAGIYDEALGLSEYVNQAGYETIDGYETVGDMQDMADYADLADAREALVPSRSTVEQIGPWSPEEATEAGGMFAHNGWGGY